MAKEVGKQNQSIKPIKQIIAFMNWISMVLP